MRACAHVLLASARMGPTICWLHRVSPAHLAGRKLLAAGQLQHERVAGKHGRLGDRGARFGSHAQALARSGVSWPVAVVAARKDLRARAWHRENVERTNQNACN